MVWGRSVLLPCKLCRLDGGVPYYMFNVWFEGGIWILIILGPDFFLHVFHLCIIFIQYSFGRSRGSIG